MHQIKSPKTFAVESSSGKKTVAARIIVRERNPQIQEQKMDNENFNDINNANNSSSSNNNSINNGNNNNNNGVTATTFYAPYLPEDEVNEGLEKGHLIKVCKNLIFFD